MLSYSIHTQFISTQTNLKCFKPHPLNFKYFKFHISSTELQLPNKHILKPPKKQVRILTGERKITSWSVILTKARLHLTDLKRRIQTYSSLFQDQNWNKYCKISAKKKSLSNDSFLRWLFQLPRKQSSDKIIQKTSQISCDMESMNIEQKEYFTLTQPVHSFGVIYCEPLLGQAHWILWFHNSCSSITRKKGCYIMFWVFFFFASIVSLVRLLYAEKTEHMGFQTELDFCEVKENKREIIVFLIPLLFEETPITTHCKGC